VTLLRGSQYSGTLLQASAGAAFHLTGSSVAAYQAITAVWWLAAALVFRRLVRNLWNPVAGDLTAALLWVGTPDLVALSLKDPGYYGPTLALAGLILLLATRLDVTPICVSAAIGVVGGLLLWTSPSGTAFALPAVIFFFLRTRPWPGWGTATLGAIVGSLPWWIWNMTNDWRSLTDDHSPSALFGDRLKDLFTIVLPAGVPGFQFQVQHTIVAAAVALTIALGISHAILRRRWDRLTVAATGVTGVMVLIGAVQQLDTTSSSRYAAFILPVAALLFAAGITSIPRMGRVAGWLAVAGIVAVTSVTIWNNSGRLERNHGNYWTGDIPALTAHLSNRHVRAVYAEYWISYEIVAQSHERLPRTPSAKIGGPPMPVSPPISYTRS